MKVFEHLRYKSSKTVTGLNCSNRDGCMLLKLCFVWAWRERRFKRPFLVFLCASLCFIVFGKSRKEYLCASFCSMKNEVLRSLFFFSLSLSMFCSNGKVLDIAFIPRKIYISTAVVEIFLEFLNAWIVKYRGNASHFVDSIGTKT